MNDVLSMKIAGGGGGRQRSLGRYMILYMYVCVLSRMFIYTYICQACQGHPTGTTHENPRHPGTTLGQPTAIRDTTPNLGPRLTRLPGKSVWPHQSSDASPV